VIYVAHSYFLRRDAKQFARKKPYIPISTLLAAAMLRDEGHAVSLFDATFADGPGDFARDIETANADALILIEDHFNFLTKMCTEQRRDDALEMIAAAKAKGWSVAVSSPDAVDNAEIYLGAGADAVLVGEGEFAISGLLRALREGRAMPEVPGIIYHDHLGALQRSLPASRPALDSLPMPAWDLVEVDDYRQVWSEAHGHFSLNIAASRGCPYTCNWCAKPTFGRRYDQRSPENVALEMREMKRVYGPDQVWFMDDIFGMSEKWIAAFSHEVRKHDAVIPFTMQSRVNLMTQSVAENLRLAGATEVWLGVESGSQRVLDAMDKGEKVEAARSATRNLKAEGIRACWFLQLGYPLEDWQDILKTRDLMRDEAPDDIGVSVAYPLPGTLFYERTVSQLGAKRNWSDTGELAMMFKGEFGTDFYRDVRDALHSEAPSGVFDDARWDELGRRAANARQKILA